MLLAVLRALYIPSTVMLLSFLAKSCNFSRFTQVTVSSESGYWRVLSSKTRSKHSHPFPVPACLLGVYLV